MSKANPLGLIASYGDSDDDSDDGTPLKSDDRAYCPGYDLKPPTVPPGIHPSPITHCPWSACYDENSGFTYYWNQQSNAVTWEAPSEYLLALKLAQQQLSTAGSTEVSAEEWQLYQQALAEKQTQKIKPVTKSILKKPDKNIKSNAKKRCVIDDEDEKIELITSYHNSDSESNEEAEIPKPNKIPKLVQKKPKPKTFEYGPPLPPNQNYTMPIGPELPPRLETKPPLPEEEVENTVNEEVKLSQKCADEECQEEQVLLKELKDKAKLLEKLGGELPSELQQIIKDGPHSVTASPKSDKEALDIDVLLEEIEKKELPKVVKSKKDDGKAKSSTESINSSPGGDKTPPLEEAEATPNANGPSLFPSSANIDKIKLEKDSSSPIENQKKENVYLMNIEPIENVNRKRLRICNSVLPDRKRDKIEVPSYTTRYAQPVEGFSSERTGLGFVRDEESADTPKNTISYGNGLTFTKGETLNEEKKDEDLDDLTDLVEAKLKFLNQIQPCSLTPVQEMMIQMQTLLSSFRAGALSASYWRRWAGGARAALAAHEAAAAPPGWKCVFLRSEARYCYSRDADGFVQFEYPAVASTDMEICTTPPHTEAKEETPSWRATPPPPGTDDSDPAVIVKKEIGDELQSFYNDIAEIEKSSGTEPNSPEPPPPPPPPEISERMKELREKREKSREREVKEKIRERELKEKIKEKDIKERSGEREIKMPKKKSKVKLSSSIGMKQKSVSNLVAKWQQVADEIHSD